MKKLVDAKYELCENLICSAEVLAFLFVSFVELCRFTLCCLFFLIAGCLNVIRSRQLFWNRMLKLIDFASSIIAMWLAWQLRFQLPYMKPVQHVTFSFGIIIGIVVSVYVANSLNGLYRSRRKETLVSEVLRLIRSHILLVLILMSILFTIKSTEFPRSVVVIYVILSFVLMTVCRLAGGDLLRRARSAGFNQKHIVLVGTKDSAERVRAEILGYPWMGYQVEGILLMESESPSRLGRTELLQRELDEMLATRLIDEVILVAPTDDKTTLSAYLNTCEQHGVQTSIVPYFFDLLPARPRLTEFGGIPTIVVRGEPLDDPFNALAKRLFDIGFSFTALLCLAPVMLVIALVTKLTSPGPIIFKQTRIGRNKRPFTIYKFRTMHTEQYISRVLIDSNATRDEIAATTDAKPSYLDGWTVENDPRRTVFGAFLRKTSLDELPQFWNVLRGDMSVIGPRPEQPKFVEQFRKSIPGYMVKHHVRPGITGWAQVNGWRGDTSISERINCDLYYIENWSFTMDLKIVWLTMYRGLVNRNAY